MSEKRKKVAVVGAGPAGIAAAQQCIREGIDDVILLERERAGGLIRQANRVENFPGFIGMNGLEIVDELRTVIDDYDIDLKEADVDEIIKSGKKRGFVLQGDPLRVEARYVILATGTEPKSLGIDGEIHEPGWKDHSGRRVVVIGGGDAVYDYSLRLIGLGADVTILRRSEPKALRSLVEEVRSCDIKEIHGQLVDWEKGQDGHTLETQDETLFCDTVVTAVGRQPCEPRLDFSYGAVDLPTGRTEVAGFYAIGSLVLGEYRQMSLCWGMGIAAAMDVREELSTEENSI